MTGSDASGARRLCAVHEVVAKASTVRNEWGWAGWATGRPYGRFAICHVELLPIGSTSIAQGRASLDLLMKIVGILKRGAATAFFRIGLAEERVAGLHLAIERQHASQNRRSRFIAVARSPITGSGCRAKKSAHSGAQCSSLSRKEQAVRGVSPRADRNAHRPVQAELTHKNAPWIARARWCHSALLRLHISTWEPSGSSSSRAYTVAGKAGSSSVTDR